MASSTIITVRPSHHSRNMSPDHGEKTEPMPNSPTSMASQSRRMRLQGGKVNPTSGASVADLKKMFEEKGPKTVTSYHQQNDSVKYTSNQLATPERYEGSSTRCATSPSRTAKIQMKYRKVDSPFDDRGNAYQKRNFHFDESKTSTYRKNENNISHRDERTDSKTESNPDLETPRRDKSNSKVQSMKEFRNEENNSSPVESTHLQSDRRRKMAMAKKFARSSNSAVKKTSSPDHEMGDPLDKEKESKNIHKISSETQNEKYADVSKSSKELSDSGLKYPASPSRRKKFELMKESMKHKRKQKSHSTNDFAMSEDDEMKSDKLSGGSASRTASTASLSTSTFETFDNINLFHSNRVSTTAEQQAIVSPISPGMDDLDKMWDIDKFAPVPPKLDNDSNYSSIMQRKNHRAISNYDNSPLKQRNIQTNSHGPRKSKESYTRSPRSTKGPTFSDMPHEKPTFIARHPQSPRESQNIDYFAPPNMHEGHTWDDDDETQFNSVVMIPENNERKQTVIVQRQIDNVDTSQQLPAPTSNGDSSNPYFASGLGGSSRRLIDPHGSPTVTGGSDGFLKDDDNDSYNGSVGNRSWTGRMRARQAFQYNGGFPTDRTNDSPSKASVFNDDNTYLSHFSASQLKTRDIGANSAYSDAQKGAEELKKFAKEDPTTTAMGLAACGAACGALLLGPFGLLIGAGITGGTFYGVSQMSEEKRSKMKDQATDAANKLKSQALDASDYVSTSCGQACLSVNSTNNAASNGTEQVPVRSMGASIISQLETVETIQPISPQNRIVSSGSMGYSQGPVARNIPRETVQPDVNLRLTQTNKRRFRRRVPACCRMNRITPVSQVHSLDPSLHPRAWLDVMASAWTSRDEKNEAMEEILLLAKDKHRARMLLEEGILDSLMHILRGFFHSYDDIKRQLGKETIPFENYMGDPNFFHSKLAANCCVALAKAHCLGVTNDMGDLTQKGLSVEQNVGISIPVSRQVALLLYEVPHHMSINMPDVHRGETKEINFKLSTNMTLQEAEDFAGSIVALSSGKIEINACFIK